MHRFPVVFGLTKFDLGFLLAEVSHDEPKMIERRETLSFQQGIIIEIALLLPNSTSRDRHKLGAPNDGFYKGFSSIFPKILDAVQRIIISPSHFRIRKF